MTELGTILGVWAHPDDETYLSAGLMANAIRQGDRVVCVTATKGEAGSLDEVRWPLDTLAEVREAELMTALSTLGVTEHEWLGYADGACDRVPFDQGVGAVRRILEAVGPDTVLTFGPDGMTGHPDHKTVSAWTGAAFDQAAPPGARLYHATITPEWMETVFPQLDRFDVFFAGRPSVTPREELGIDFELDRDLLDCKFQAIAAQVSQSEGMIAGLGRDFFDSSQRGEYFRLAAAKGA